MSGERFHGIDAVSVIGAQLGRVPSIEFEVDVTCEYGWPAVIRNSPVDSRGAANPNLFYLTCPYLRKAISTLEDSGAIVGIQEAVEADVETADSLRAAQRTHGDLWAEAAGDVMEKQGSNEVMLDPARRPRIADTKKDFLLKCLHAHMAYYLVNDDHTIGKMIEERLESRWCEDETCGRLFGRGEGN